MLIDTHILIWSVEGMGGDMGPQTQVFIREAFSDFIVSAASILEIKLKQRRHGLKEIGLDSLLNQLRDSRVDLISIEPKHILEVPGQKDLHHADPFDLILIAQAVSEKLPFLTCDQEILALNFPGLRLVDGRK